MWLELTPHLYRINFLRLDGQARTPVFTNFYLITCSFTEWDFLSGENAGERAGKLEERRFSAAFAH